MGSRSRADRISLFTTLRFEEGRGCRFWPDHLRRLEEGAARFGLRGVSPPALLAEIERAAAGLEDARVRVRIHPDREFDVEARAYSPPADPWVLQPVVVSPDEDTVRYKTDRRVVYEEASRQVEVGRQALLEDRRGRILECTIANVFFVLRGDLLTPPAAAPLLPGIARRRVIEAARGMRIDVREEPLSANEVASAEACFVTNALFGIHPVAEIAGRQTFSGSGLARRLSLALAS